MTCNCLKLSIGAAGSALASQKQKNPPGAQWRLLIMRLVCISWDDTQDSSLFLNVTDLGFGVNILDLVFRVTDLRNFKKDTQQYLAHVDKSILVILAPEYWAVESF